MKWTPQADPQKNYCTEVHSFEEYMELASRQPRTFARSSNIYFKDLFEYFGREEQGAFKLFQQEYPGSIPICGQRKCQQRIYDNLVNFCEEGFNNKFILLVGPNGSCKTSLIRKIMLAAEEYSQTEEGLLHTFSWVFPVDGQIKRALGLQNIHQGDSLESFAHLDDAEIAAIIGSDLKDHPLLLIPPKTRQNILQEWLAQDPAAYHSIKKSTLSHGKLTTKNQMIYDTLLRSYKGDHLKVFKHIRVERFTISRSQSTSAVSIEPQMHVDAKMQQLTMDKRLASLPPSMQSLNLYQLHGEAVLANRGVLEFSDLLKRPLDAFKYLLMTVESKNINLQGILLELDILFMGTSNEIQLQAFKQHPDFNSFKGRINLIRVPYLLSATEEAHIYDEQIKNLSERCCFEPGTIEALCLFAVMTRIRPPQEKNFADKKLGKTMVGLKPLEKVLFLSKDELPERLSTEEKQSLRAAKNLLVEEYANETVYEGNFGISPREIQQIIYDISAQNQTITFVEVIEYLHKFIEKKNEYEFLNIPPQGSYHSPSHFIQAIKEYSLKQFDLQLRSSLGLVDERSYEDYIAKYVLHISALLKGEKIKSPLTRKDESSDMFFIKEFENNINLQEDANKFRTHTISRLGAFSLDNPAAKIVYTEVFPELTKKLKQSFHQEQGKKIKKIAKNLVYYLAEEKDDKEEITQLLANLKQQFHYSKEGAIKLLKYAIKEQY